MISKCSIFTRLRNWLWSVYFNFHYLPFHQAKLLPIRFHKPKFINLAGKVRISGRVWKGMITLGEHQHGLYPDGGFIFENNGGEIVFDGRINIGGNSAFSIGKYGKLVMEGSLNSITGLKIVCYHYIHIHENCRIGWDVMMMDTSFHPLKSMDGAFISKGVAPIILSHDTWISTRCLVTQGAKTAPYTVLAANSMLNKAFSEPYVLLAGSPATIKKRGVYRDMGYDMIDFSKYSLI